MGLIGGIGAGKSAVAAGFAARGGRVIDADKLGHEALERPEVRASILKRWGESASLLRPDGTLDRRAIGRIVFADPHQLRALESIVFPVITSRIQNELARAQADAQVPFVVLDAAVMLEAGWNDVCDYLVYVDAPRPLRLARLAARSGWSDADLTAREASQMSAELKRQQADIVLTNDSGMCELQEKVDGLLRKWSLGSEENVSRV